MEYCASMCCFGHKNIVKFVEKQWWGSCEGFIFPRNELNKLDHCFYHEGVAICSKYDKDDRYTCQRFKPLHNELSNCWLWKVRRYSPSQTSYYKVFFFIIFQGTSVPQELKFLNVSKARPYVHLYFSNKKIVKNDQNC